jgi:AcrR family transcriptional regulator
MPTRTADEVSGKRGRTRARLIEAAAELFAEQGFHGATLADVAGRAGMTTGAIYGNFKSKEELFLAMLDERFAHRIGEIERVIAGHGSTSEKAQRAGDEVTQMMSADPEWERLFFEFSAYAARNEDFREELMTRYQWMRDRIATALETRAAEFGIQSPVPYDQVAVMTCAMANGVALEKLLAGDSASDELYGTMLIVFFAGLKALKQTGLPVTA